MFGCTCCGSALRPLMMIIREPQLGRPRLALWSGALTSGEVPSQCSAVDRGLPGLIARQQRAVLVAADDRRGRKQASRHVGELALERIGGTSPAGVPGG